MELDKNGNFLFASNSVKLVIPLKTPIFDFTWKMHLGLQLLLLASEIQAWKVFLGDIQS